MSITRPVALVIQGDVLKDQSQESCTKLQLESGKWKVKSGKWMIFMIIITCFLLDMHTSFEIYQRHSARIQPRYVNLLSRPTGGRLCGTKNDEGIVYEMRYRGRRRPQH